MYRFNDRHEGYRFKNQPTAAMRYAALQYLYSLLHLPHRLGLIKVRFMHVQNRHTGDLWYLKKNHPIALRRAHTRFLCHWIHQQISLESNTCKVLDLGCGAGFLSNFLAQRGHQVTGMDESLDVLRVAKKFDRTNSVQYLRHKGQNLELPPNSFDVICATHFLEYSRQPELMIAEIARVLKSDGLFIFSTFNRNWLSHLFVTKGLQWLSSGSEAETPPMHSFLKPHELRQLCIENGLNIEFITGLKPKLLNPYFLKTLTQREVSDGFEFEFTMTKSMAYAGLARKVTL